MGGRLSKPRSPSGSEEAPGTSLTSTSPRTHQPPPKSPRAGTFQPRVLLVPLSAVLLSGMIFVYSRTTVAAAKENARRAREADGGSISWRREGMRRHGRLEKVEERTLWAQLTGEKEKEGQRREIVDDVNPIEEGIRRAREGRGKERPGRGDSAG